MNTFSEFIKQPLSLNFVSKKGGFFPLGIITQASDCNVRLDKLCYEVRFDIYGNDSDFIRSNVANIEYNRDNDYIDWKASGSISGICGNKLIYIPMYIYEISILHYTKIATLFVEIRDIDFKAQYEDIDYKAQYGYEAWEPKKGYKVKKEENKIEIKKLNRFQLMKIK